MKHRKRGKVGSSFDGFLAEEGILEECEERAIKQILADQIKVQWRRTASRRRPWPYACEPAAEHSTVCSIQQIRALPCTLCNARLRRSAANSGWNWPETADAIAPSFAGKFRRR